MTLKTLLLAGSMAISAMGHVVGERQRAFSCGAPAASAEHLSASKELAAKEALARSGGRQSLAPINVNVYMHVVSTSTSEADGYLSDATLNAQIAVMNEDYAPSGISFTLKGTDKTVNSNWANDKSEMAMKKALRKGTYRDLNLYFLTYLSGYLGYCYFPTTAAAGSSTFTLDGCSIVANSTPGGDAPFDEGKTATHEVGHWFGLYHTFQGGCNGSGDMIDDTPAQASASSGCPTGRDSCKNLAGLDPIHNYMDYSDDSCYVEFTPNQQQRMASMFNKYRA